MKKELEKLGLPVPTKTCAATRVEPTAGRPTCCRSRLRALPHTPRSVLSERVPPPV